MNESMTQFETYTSPFSWRYGSQPMRQIWGEVNKRRLWRTIWVSLAQAQADFGLVHQEQVEDLRTHLDRIDMERSLSIEAEIHHDLMAELMSFAEQAPIGGKILHLGATSMDIEDNADAMRIRASLDIILDGLETLLAHLCTRVEQWAELTVIAFTHLQPAEPTTLGYRLAFIGQDILQNYLSLRELRDTIRGKGFKGAVGTGAAYIDLIGAGEYDRFESLLSKSLDLPFFPITNQTYPRRQDYSVVSELAITAASLSKFALDLRILQSPPIGELSEPFGRNQVGSSAMPFKRNPVRSEKINSLARQLAQIPRLAWDNAALSILERTLDDSANRRTYLPEAFLILDEIIHTLDSIIQGLQIDEKAIARNLLVYGIFASSERVLVALTKAGADRQEMHARLREHALNAWKSFQAGGVNPLGTLIRDDPLFRNYLPVGQIEALLQVDDYVGIAPRRSREFASLAHQTIMKSRLE
jgi:adenylosuccinate lyase